MAKEDIRIGELSEGNLLYYLYNRENRDEIVKVTSIDPLIVKREDGEEWAVPIFSLSPIPLTEEHILNNFMFIRDGWDVDEDGQRHIHSTNWRYFLKRTRSEAEGCYCVSLYSDYRGFTCGGIVIPSVHRLQNLLKAAGHDTEIKL